MMSARRKWRRFIDHPVVEWGIFAVGVILLLLSPVVGAVPGPGGVIVAGIGLAMVLKTSMWARRHYVRFKKWQPKAGRWTDWALRRRSARRREALRQRREARAASLPLADAIEDSAVGALIPAPPVEGETAPDEGAGESGRGGRAD